MTREEAKQWIENLIKTMRIETSGSYPDSAYKDEVYVALDMAIKSLEAWNKVYDDIDKLDCFDREYAAGASDVCDIIDKHLKEVENGI